MSGPMPPDKWPRPDEQMATLREVILDRVRLMLVENDIEPAVFEVDVREMAYFMAERYALRITAEFLAGRQSESEDDGEYVPQTWRDAFKQRFFPSWWLRRWPVRERWIATQVRRLHVCPHVPPPRGGAELSDHYGWVGTPHPCCSGEEQKP